MTSVAAEMAIVASGARQDACPGPIPTMVNRPHARPAAVGSIILSLHAIAQVALPFLRFWMTRLACAPADRSAAAAATLWQPTASNTYVEALDTLYVSASNSVAV